MNELYGTTYSIVFPGYSFSAILNFIKVFMSAFIFRKKDSLIVFQKLHTNGIYSFFLRILLYFRRKNTIYDIDDAIYTTENKKIINYFAKNSERCSVGSHSLFDYFNKINSNTSILTSPIIKHNFEKTKKQETFTIGWIGFYNAHKESLQELIFPDLIKIDFKVKILLLGITKIEDRNNIIKYFSTNKNVIVEIPEGINWLNEDSVYKLIQTFDIGISPLLATERNKAKSAFKLKQYMSCGVPVLASRTGENNFFLNEGLDGYFCENSKEFYDKIKYFSDISDEKYHEYCKNAFNSVKNFNLELYITTLRAIFN